MATALARRSEPASITKRLGQVELRCACGCGGTFLRNASQAPRGLAFKNAAHRETWRAREREARG